MILFEGGHDVLSDIRFAKDGKTGVAPRGAPRVNLGATTKVGEEKMPAGFQHAANFREKFVKRRITMRRFHIHDRVECAVVEGQMFRITGSEFEARHAVPGL